MKIKVISTLLLSCLLFFCQLSHASMPPKPKKCPSEAAIRAVGISVVQPNNGTWVAGVLSNKYNTNEVWMFAVGDIVANNEADARAKAVDSLNSLALVQGPIPVTQYQVWACLYHTAQGYRAVTITPPLTLSTSLQLTK